MKNDPNTQKMVYDVDDLPYYFYTILQTQPNYIQLTSPYSQHQDVVGTYKRFPYYQKIYSTIDKQDLRKSRYIIHKHMVSGQWQLTEFSNWPFACSKVIKSSGCEITETKENGILLETSQKASINQEVISNLEKALAKEKNYNEFLLSILKSKHPNVFKSEEQSKLHIQNNVSQHLNIERQDKEETVSEQNTRLKTELEVKLEKELYHSKSQIKSLLNEIMFSTEIKCQGDQSFHNQNQKEIETMNSTMDSESKIQNEKIDSESNQFEKVKHLERKLQEKDKVLRKFGQEKKEFATKLKQQENEILNLQNQLKFCEKLQKEKNQTHEEKIRLMKNENISKFSNLKNENVKQIEKLKNEFQIFEKKNEISILKTKLFESEDKNKHLQEEIQTFKFKQENLENTISDLQIVEKNLNEKILKLKTLGENLLKNLTHEKQKIKQLEFKLETKQNVTTPTKVQKIDNEKMEQKKENKINKEWNKFETMMTDIIQKENEKELKSKFEKNEINKKANIELLSNSQLTHCIKKVKKELKVTQDSIYEEIEINSKCEKCTQELKFPKNNDKSNTKPITQKLSLESLSIPFSLF
jgi:hypothetical protein